jgi:diguanylate cyclase (GGDEF)-like protein
VINLELGRQIAKGKKTPPPEIALAAGMTQGKMKVKMKITQPGVYSFVLACGWTMVVALSLLVDMKGYKKEMLAIATNVARAYIDKDMLFRDWNTMHGGVYVPVTPENTPNQNLLKSVPEQDIKTPTGRVLTFINPTYMMRQVYELAQKEKKISGHVTSLKPLRPENKPDSWDTSALIALEGGKQEVSEIVTEGGRRYLKLMRPLKVEKSCLPCHSQQGYQEGDIGGGIAVTFPMELLEVSTWDEEKLLLSGHALMWLLGLTGLYGGYRGLRQRTLERDKAEDELKKANAALENLATTDFLTGTFNRRKFEEVIHTEVAEAKRLNLPISLIFFDIDHFKKINDKLGHESGDAVLREIGLAVRKSLREIDIFARYGGEEFVILTYNDRTSAGKLAEKIRAAIEHHNFAIGEKVTCSFGVTQFCHTDTIDQFVNRADLAMYEAKKGGRNLVVERSC